MSYLVSSLRFQYVDGKYLVKIKECSTCDGPPSCSETEEYGTGNAILASCGTNTSMATIVEEHLLYDQQMCSFQFQAKLPMCTEIQHYSEANFSIIKVNQHLLYYIH